MSETVTSPSLFVGIGASAGGLDALKTLLPQLPGDSGIVYVIVVHLSPDQPSLMAEILTPFSPMPIKQAGEELVVEPNHIYVIPPGKDLTFVDGRLRPSKIDRHKQDRSAIDHFFETMAKAHGDGCVGVVLSGSGADGSYGVRVIKEFGGVTIAQEPSESQFDSMPQNAIETGLVDLVLPVGEMPAHLLRLATTRPRIELREDSDARENNKDRGLLQEILAEVRARTNVDFSQYKNSTVARRIRRRMQLNQKELLENYLEFLRNDPNETRLLAEEFLITVTQFFRDADVFAHLEREVIPELFEGKTSADTVRVWSVGCATGEEAYSLTMLLLEHAGRVTDPPRIEVFATDLHEPSLRRARDGCYPDSIEAEIPAERLRRFFVKEDSGYRIRKEVREVVVFAVHNLLRDPPFSRLHLIVCRNLLIYLQRGLQHDVIDLFHYSLRPEGMLLLGPSEAIDRSGLFQLESKQYCLYRRRNVPAPEPKLPVFPQTLRRYGGVEAANSRVEAGGSYGLLHQKIVERLAPPSVLVDQDFRLVHVSERAGRYLRIPGGELSVSVFKLAREELCVELRAALHAAVEHGESRRTRPISIEIDGRPKQVVLYVQPSADAEIGSLNLVIFIESEASDAVPSAPLSRDAAEARAELDETRDRLHTVIEQYETSQEEMRATNEELQSVNEELRSTMEELETGREELQSMNEELQTVNQENRDKVEALSQLTSDLQNLMASTDIATLFLDKNLRIMRATPRAQELLNIRTSDQGRPFSELRHGLGCDLFDHDATRVIEMLTPIEREIQSGEGEWYLSRVNPYRSSSDEAQGVVITLVNITQLKKAELDARNSEEIFRVLVAAYAQTVWTADAEGKVVEDSPSWRTFTGQSEAERQGEGWLDAVHPDDLASFLAEWRGSMKTHRALEAEFRLRHKGGEWRWTQIRAAPLKSQTDAARGWVCMNTDITEKRLAENSQRESEMLREADRRKDEFLAMLGHELRNPLTPLRNAMAIIERRLPQDAEFRRLGEICERQLTHLARLVDDLLDIAMIRSGGGMKLTKKRVDLRVILKTALATVKTSIDKREQELIIEQSQPLFVYGDEVRLVQIFTNLLDNSAKYTQEGGRIRVVLWHDGCDALMSVADNGIGIGAETLPRVFDIFMRAEPSSRNQMSGLGLGLALVHRLVELHGGSIEARSGGLSKGAEFIVRLPLADPYEDSDEKKVGPSRGSSTADKGRVSRRVLLVEDNPDVAETLKLVLELDGHHVLLTHDGRGALKAAAAQRPDIVLLDIGLPDMSGYEVARRLRSEATTSGAMLVAVTGHGAPSDCILAQEAGIDQHLIKPVEPSALLAIVRGAGGHASEKR
jgi:two-component system, chemotaxis family, CheB/CheR fusion protein